MVQHVYELSVAPNMLIRTLDLFMVHIGGPDDITKIRGTLVSLGKKCIDVGFQNLLAYAFIMLIERKALLRLKRPNLGKKALSSCTCLILATCGVASFADI